MPIKGPGYNNESSKEWVRYQVILDRKYADMVNNFADRLGLSRGQFLKNTIQMAIDDNEWFLKLLSSKYMTPVLEWMQEIKGKKRHKTKGKEPKVAVDGA